MTITQLKYVLSVAEYKNFTIAAEHSFVTQPTLSMQIQKLEDHLGVLIFFPELKGSIGIFLMSATEMCLSLWDPFAKLVKCPDVCKCKKT